MSDVIARTAPRPGTHDHRRPTPTDHHGSGPPLIDLERPVAVLDLTDRRVPTPSARTIGTRPVVVEHAVAIEIPDDDAVTALTARWLSDSERATAAAKGERARRGHVLGRVAAKQAVQAHLGSLGFTAIEPSRIEITNVASGRPLVRVRGARVATRHLAISIAHGRGAAGAVATTITTTTTTTTTGIGIDIEAVEARSSRFERLTLSPAERDLVPVAGDDRDTWLTRLWSAKEAAAKATGLGLQGRPRDFAVDRVIGERLRIGNRWINTELTTFAGIAHIIAVTETHRTECAWHRS